MPQNQSTTLSVDPRRVAPPQNANTLPVAHAGGRWISARADDSRQWIERRNPALWDQTLSRIPTAGPAELDAACGAAQAAFERWRNVTPAQRVVILQSWADALQSEADELAAEVNQAAALIRAASARTPELFPAAAESGAKIMHQPHGVVALITPWNNPVAIAVGKIAPALAMGNAVVWKPAMHAPRTAMRVLDLLVGAGVPSGAVNLVFGEAATAEALIEHSAVRAVSLTGSGPTGRSAASRCLRRNIPLQAELGGNNAAIVMADYDFVPVIRQLVLGSFSFCGQRCTAIRRWIVQREVMDDFRRLFVAAVASLKSGDPLDEMTELGPLVSREHRDRIIAAVAQAKNDGASVLCGGEVPADRGRGCWLNPIVLDHVEPDHWIAQSETFGPVASLLAADDLDHALRIANNVEHGLVAAMYTNIAEHRQRFIQTIQAGILQFDPGPIPVCPHAPFGGWKASGIGLPEHGAWDSAFYARPQGLYGSA